MKGNCLWWEGGDEREPFVVCNKLAMDSAAGLRMYAGRFAQRDSART